MKKIDLKDAGPEFWKKVMGVKSKEELIALAKEHDYELTDKDADMYMGMLEGSAQELSDEHLDAVAGGCPEWLETYPHYVDMDGKEHIYQPSNTQKYLLDAANPKNARYIEQRRAKGLSMGGLGESAYKNK